MKKTVFILILLFTLTTSGGIVPLYDPYAVHVDGLDALAGNWSLGGYNLTNGGDITAAGAITGGSLVVDTDTLVVNASGYEDKVGIGTSSPDSVFHIKAGTSGTVGSHPAGQLIIQNPTDSVFSNAVITGYESDGDGNPNQQLWYLGSSSSGNTDIIFLNRRNAKLALGTSGTSRITILGNGNVGINEVTPDSKLEINGDLHVKDKIAFTQDDKNEYIDSLADGYMDYGATTAHRFNTDVVVTGAVTGESFVGLEQSSNPTEPSDGEMVIWLSDGSGYGDAGDVMISSATGGAARYGTLFDFSGGTLWAADTMVYEDGDTMVFEDGETMVYE